jgi:hypothetical protein
MYGSYFASLFWDEAVKYQGDQVYLSPLQGEVDFRFGTRQPNNLPKYMRPAAIGTKFSVTTAIKEVSVESLYVNGAMVLTQSGKLSPITGVSNVGTVGRGWNNTGFLGQIAEVLVYNRALTAAERQAVEQYLKSKYGL